MSNEYVEMRPIDALHSARYHTMLLPDIQREYVWEMNDIEKLFESIVDDYPVGSCIFWKTNKKILNKEKPNMYYFIEKYKKGETKNIKAPEVFDEESDYYIVLDGQQRITSLCIALYGSYTMKKRGKGYLASNSKSWVERELYYNLDFYTTNSVDDENPTKRFVFLSNDEAAEGNYYKVKHIIQYDDMGDFIDSIMNFDKKCKKDLMQLYRRIMEDTKSSVIHYYCISENTYDEALDIFVRVNSTGRKLSKSDLLFSTLIDGWKDGKDNVENILNDINHAGDSFRFSRDYLMRLALILVNGKTDLKIESLTQDIIHSIRNNWTKIDNTLRELSNLLVNIGMCDENISSYNSTMPLAYFIYKGGKFDTFESKKEARKFLAVSMTKGLFGVASNDALKQSRDALINVNSSTRFSLSLFKDIKLTGNRTFTVDLSEIEYWLNTFEKGRNTFILLSLLYPNLKLNQIDFHQDHCHPWVCFEKKNIKLLGLDESKVTDWQKKRNLLPNLQFLKGAENGSKNKKPLIDWVNNGNDFEYHPKNISLEFKDFDSFFAERKKMMKNELCKIFDIQNDDNK